SCPGSHVRGYGTPSSADSSGRCGCHVPGTSVGPSAALREPYLRDHVLSGVEQRRQAVPGSGGSVITDSCGRNACPVSSQRRLASATAACVPAPSRPPPLLKY